MLARPTVVEHHDSPGLVSGAHVFHCQLQGDKCCTVMMATCLMIYIIVEYNLPKYDSLTMTRYS